MLDVMYLIAVVGFGLLSSGLIVLCERLMGDRQ
jgi:hypothetical protein